MGEYGDDGQALDGKNKQDTHSGFPHYELDLVDIRPMGNDLHLYKRN